MAITPEDIRKVAKLSRLEVTDENVPALVEEMNKILDTVRQLQEIDATGVEPMRSVVEIPTRLRADGVNDGEITDKILANAPESAEGFFVVPKVVE